MAGNARSTEVSEGPLLRIFSLTKKSLKVAY